MTLKKIFDGVDLLTPFRDVAGTDPVKATGKLSDSAEQRQTDTTLELLAFDYWYRLQQGVGTSPADAVNLTIDEIETWAVAKFGAGVSNFAIWNIWKAIKEKGTRSYQGTNKFYDDPFGEKFTDEFFENIFAIMSSNVEEGVRLEIIKSAK